MAAHAAAPSRISTSRTRGESSVRRTSAAAPPVRPATARTAKASMAADITVMATVVAAASGSDHCQPTVSCDHMAAPKPAKIAAHHPSEVKLARTCAEASSGHPQNPAAASRATIPARITSAVRVRDRGRSQISAISSSANSSP